MSWVCQIIGSSSKDRPQAIHLRREHWIEQSVSLWVSTVDLVLAGPLRFIITLLEGKAEVDRVLEVGANGPPERAHPSRKEGCQPAWSVLTWGKHWNSEASQMPKEEHGLYVPSLNSNGLELSQS